MAEVSTNAIAQLKNDHQLFRGLLAKLEDTSENAKKTRHALFAELKRELVAHATLEEEFLYPAVEEVADEEHAEDLKHSYEEHHVVDVLLDELTILKVDDEAWGAKVHVLRENLVHHLEEEEEDLFPYAQKVIDAAELDELGLDMADRRDEALEQADAAKDETVQSKPIEKR